MAKPKIFQIQLLASEYVCNYYCMDVCNNYSCKPQVKNSKFFLEKMTH